MSHDEPRDRPSETPAGDDDAARPRGRRIRLAATAGTEIVISVLVALAFFAVFMLTLTVIMPSGLGLNEVMKPAADTGTGAGRAFSASLDGLAHLNERLNPAAAVLTVLNTTVMRKPADGISWGQASNGTALQEGDAVQTSRDGTALLTFSRHKHLQLEQNSMLIVRANHVAADATDPPPSVHVLVGELWGNVGRDTALSDHVQVTSPGAETSLLPADDSSGTQFRLAVRKNQTSVLSVYHGVAQVVSRGQTVRVTANQFVSMDSVRGVAAPAPLPSAPVLVAPGPEASYTYRELAPQVTFRWDPIPEVDGYRLILSQSPEFQGVVLDQRVTGTSFSYGNWKSGSYFWRVSALHSGAEGPPSEPRVVVVSSVQRQPELMVQFPAAVVSTDRAEIRGTAEPGVRIVVAGARAPIDGAGNFRQTVALKRGFNVLVVEAIDRIGNTAYKSKVVEAKY